MTPAAALSTAADDIDTATCIDDTDLCGFDELGRAASAAGANGAIPPTATLTPSRSARATSASTTPACASSSRTRTPPAS